MRALDRILEERSPTDERTELLWHGCATGERRELSQATALAACEDECPRLTE
jgi:hypothetical protein